MSKIGLFVLSLSSALSFTSSSFAACAAGEVGGTVSVSSAVSEKGYSYVIWSIKSWGIKNDSSSWTQSTLKLYENGRALGPAHAKHSEIASLGRGRFSDYNSELRFSASDNTNPKTNKRTYTYCGVPIVKPSPTPTPSPTVTPSPTPTVTVTPSPTPTVVPVGGYESLLNELVGFGSGTTGGKGGSLYTVTSLADSGAGTLREALTQKNPLWIRFAVSGTIALKSEILPASNKTIDGRGADITITTNGISVEGGASNVVIAYVKFKNVLDDAVRLFGGSSKLWVHHCDFTANGDGAIDATEGVTDITVSYVHIYDQDKSMLIGASSDTGNGSNLRWTAHHNWYERVIQRVPFVRMGKAHSFNNLISWLNGTAIEVSFSPGQFYSENDILNPLTNQKLISIHDGAAAKFSGSYQTPSNAGLNVAGLYPATVFDPRSYYSYTPEVANAALETKIKATAGWKAVSFPQ